MVSVKKFKEWLSEDISISTELQKIITRKIAEYIELNSVEGKLKVKKTEVIDKIS